MSKGRVYRQLIHDFFDGKITAVELKERVQALGLKQMELFSDRAPDTGRDKENPHFFRRP